MTNDGSKLSFAKKRGHYLHFKDGPFKSQNFNETSEILKKEANKRGHKNFEDIPPKTVVLKPSIVQIQKLPMLAKSNQTDFPIDPKVSYILESSVYDLAENQEADKPVQIFYSGVKKFKDNSSEMMSNCSCYSQEEMQGFVCGCDSEQLRQIATNSLVVQGSNGCCMYYNSRDKNRTETQNAMREIRKRNAGHSDCTRPLITLREKTNANEMKHLKTVSIKSAPDAFVCIRDAVKIHHQAKYESKACQMSPPNYLENDFCADCINCNNDNNNSDKKYKGTKNCSESYDNNKNEMNMKDTATNVNNLEYSKNYEQPEEILHFSEIGAKCTHGTALCSDRLQCSDATQNSNTSPSIDKKPYFSDKDNALSKESQYSDVEPQISIKGISESEPDNLEEAENVPEILVKTAKFAEKIEQVKKYEREDCKGQGCTKVVITELKNHLAQLEDEHQKLMCVASLLTLAIQNHILQKTESLNNILDKCRCMCPHLFSKNSDEPDKPNLWRKNKSDESETEIEFSSIDVIPFIKYPRDTIQVRDLSIMKKYKDEDKEEEKEKLLFENSNIEMASAVPSVFNPRIDDSEILTDNLMDVMTSTREIVEEKREVKAVEMSDEGEKQDLKNNNTKKDNEVTSMNLGCGKSKKTNDKETKEKEIIETEAIESEIKDNGIKINSTKKNETNEIEIGKNETKESGANENGPKENEAIENGIKKNEDKENELKEQIETNREYNRNDEIRNKTNDCTINTNEYNGKDRKENGHSTKKNGKTAGKSTKSASPTKRFSFDDNTSKISGSLTSNERNRSAEICHTKNGTRCSITCKSKTCKSKCTKSEGGVKIVPDSCQRGSFDNDGNCKNDERNIEGETNKEIQEKIEEKEREKNEEITEKGKMIEGLNRDENTEENCEKETVKNGKCRQRKEEEKKETSVITKASDDNKIGKYLNLDFKKIKKDMYEGNEITKLKLLKSLRWSITQSTSEERDFIVESLIRNDLLGLHSNPCSIVNKSFLENFYHRAGVKYKEELQESIARLVNSIASLTIGRNYLSSSEDFLLFVLLPLVLGEHESNVTLTAASLEHVLATLQKLSLRRHLRLLMINAGLVEYLIQFLDEKYNVISSYCLEYTTALLMNLSLHNETREKCRKISNKIVQLFPKLLNAKYQCSLPYVNGALYSLLTDPTINEEAKKFNLEKILLEHINKREGEIQKQLELILQMHKTCNYNADCICDSNAEPQEEVDLLEPELDLNDTVDLPSCGKTFLETYAVKLDVVESPKHQNSLCICGPTSPKATHHISEVLGDYTMCMMSLNERECRSVKLGALKEDSKENFYKENTTEYTESTVNEDYESNPDYDSNIPERDTTRSPRIRLQNGLPYKGSKWMKISPEVMNYATTLIEEVSEEAEKLINERIKNEEKRRQSDENSKSIRRSSVEKPQDEPSLPPKPLKRRSIEENNNKKYEVSTGKLPPKPVKRRSVEEAEYKKYDESSSILSSPALSYSEETKQMCKKPTKRGVFDRKKWPSSYTKTVINQGIRNPEPPKLGYGVENNFCPQRRYRYENSSALNPPYALDYYPPCYRTNMYFQPIGYCKYKSPCQPNRYMCSCYDAMRTYIEQSLACIECHHVDRASCSVKCSKMTSSSTITRDSDRNNCIPRSKVKASNVRRKEQQSDETSVFDILENSTYEEIFQSRPKILRTPP